MNRILLALTIFVGTHLFAVSAHADKLKLAGEPVVMIGKIRSLNAIKENVDLMGRWIGQPKLWELKDTIATRNDGQTIKLDFSSIAPDKPIGFAATASNHSVVVVPTTDSSAFLSAFQEFSKSGKQLGKGIWNFDDTVFARDYKAFVLMASDLKTLKSFGNSLARELKSLESPTLVTARIFARGVPPQMRRDFFEQMRSMDPPPPYGEQPKVTKFRDALRTKQRKLMFELASGVDTITLNAGLDKQKEDLLVEIDFAGKPNSLLAKIPQTARKRVRFAGFHQPNASISLEMHSNDNKSLAWMLRDFQLGIPKQTKKEMGPHFLAMFKEMERTLLKDGIDLVVSGDYWPLDQPKLLCAITMSDTSVPEKMLKDLIVNPKENLEVSRTTLQGGLECYKLVREVHSAGIVDFDANWNNDEDAFDDVIDNGFEKAIDASTGFVAFSNDAVLISFGANAEANLLKAIVESSKPRATTPPFFGANFSFAQSMKFIEQMSPVKRHKDGMALSDLVDGNTNIGIAYVPIENGVKMRVRSGNGVFKAMALITSLGAKVRQLDGLEGVPLSQSRR